ncbi:GNAT family N-acetyltransferase [Halioxenophilus aromaticivorans]|uniref:GNAT family N-acetyltransferase n=1 Tax=Halioxenophilus aromaticivorans TaxID=1306992 RepID=A0AAV3U5F7_9ALTE
MEPTIFHQPWWLDIVTDNQWQAVDYHDGQRTLGRLPYWVSKNKLGLKVITPPPMTHFLGPAVDAGSGKPNTLFLKNYRVTQALLKQLPKAGRCYFKCHGGIQDTLGFQNAGFHTAVQFTHEIAPAPREVLWESFRTKARNMIRSARRCHEFEYGYDADEFIQFYAQNIDSKGKENRRDELICSRLIRACLDKNRGQIYQVRDHRGRLAAAMFCAWDTKASYYLLTTRTPNSHSGATPLIVWQAILDASSRGLVFDFDGVISEGGIRFANNFTADLKPRYIAFKNSCLYSLYSKTLARKPKHGAVFRPSPL